MPVQEGTDPDGSGGLNIVKVTKEGRALGSALAETDQGHAIGEGTGYTLVSSYNLTGGEEALSLQNDGDDIHIPRVVVSTAATGVVSVMRMTSGTPAGTVITAKNSKFGLPNLADITAFGNASVTGSVDGDIHASDDVGTERPHSFILENFIIVRAQVLFVRFAVSGVVHVTVHLHREG